MSLSGGSPRSRVRINLGARFRAAAGRLPSPDASQPRAAVTSGDVWNGKQLPDRKVITSGIHYRIYSVSGVLLSFNSTNSLTSLAHDVLRTQREYPGTVLHLVRYDGPAYLALFTSRGSGSTSVVTDRLLAGRVSGAGETACQRPGQLRRLGWATPLHRS